MIFIKTLKSETSTKRNHQKKIISMKGSVVNVDGTLYMVGNMFGYGSKNRCELLNRQREVVDYIPFEELLKAAGQ